MSTKTVIDNVKLKAAGWARDGSVSIGQNLDACQRLMFSKPCKSTVYVDSTTGQHPVLATQDGVYIYDVPNFTRNIGRGDAPTYTPIPRELRISKVLDVYVKANITTEYSLLVQDPTRLASNIIREYKDDKYIVAADGISATEVESAKIVFDFNPGTTTDRYYYKSLIEPLRITADTIPLMVEEVWEPDLIEGVLAMIERPDYGRSDRWNYFINDACVRFWKEGNEGASARRVTTPRPRHL